jgi:hypothetical protein
MPYALLLKKDRRPLGDISDADYQFLQDNLEEESVSDTDYTISRLTLDFMRGSGISDHLAAVLTAALGDLDEVEIVFEARAS